MEIFRIFVTALLFLPIWNMVSQTLQTSFYNTPFEHLILLHSFLNAVIIFGIWCDNYLLLKKALICCVGVILIISYQIQILTFATYWQHLATISLTTTYVLIKFVTKHFRIKTNKN